MMENLKEIDLLLMAVPEDIHDNAWVQDAIKMLRRLNMRFEPQLPKLIAARFPGVCDFEIDHLAERVQPVEYEDCKGRMANEWPPVACWRVGVQRFRYVLKPTFRTERWGVLCFGGTTVRANYSDEDGKLWQLLQWSSEGKTADEMNRLLGNEQPNAELTGDALARRPG